MAHYQGQYGFRHFPKPAEYANEHMDEFNQSLAQACSVEDIRAIAKECATIRLTGEQANFFAMWAQAMYDAADKLSFEYPLEDWAAFWHDYRYAECDSSHMLTQADDFHSAVNGLQREVTPC